MVKPVSSRATALVIALVVGFGVFAIACFSDVMILKGDHDPWFALIDDFSVGAFAAGLVLYYEWRRDVELRRKLSTIAEMNHHVRNQLEVIEYSAWTTHDKAHIARMHESVAHIQWALREILGNRLEFPPALPPPKPPCTVRHASVEQSNQLGD